MADNKSKQPKLNSELALEIERLMAESKKAAEKNTDNKISNDPKELEVSADEKSETVPVTEEKPQDYPVQDTEDVDVHEEKSAEHTEQDATETDGNDEKTDINKEPEKKGFPVGTILIILGIIIGLFLIGAAVTYFAGSKQYENVFFENTYINNVDVSNMTSEEVKTLIKNLCKDYQITVKSRYREPEIISAGDVGLEYVTGEEIDSILARQEPLRFYFERNQVKEYDIPTMLYLDEAKLQDVCSKLSSFDDSTVTESENAYIGDYDTNTSQYVIVPEKNGNKITDKNKALQYISEHILELDSEVDLEEIGEDIYPVADVTSDDQELNAYKGDLDKFVKTKITYVDSDIVLDGSIIKNWLIIDDDKNITLDDDKIKAFVVKLADHYDTVGKERPLKSWYGNDTKVSGGTFGWELDQESEFNELKELIPQSTVAEREPVFLKRGIVHGENDWGDTYVEINLAKQHLFFIKEGELVVESDVVSGGLQRKCPTPEGVYCINYKARNAVLRGPRQADGSYQWESPVSYWMPFNKGIGLHDASWRGSFGGNIYKYNGSHGCVNLPKKNAKIIYENIEAGVPVLVYSDDFVVEEKETEAESETETKAKKKKVQTQTQPATQPAAETQPETQAETQPETQPETESQTQGEVGPGITPPVTEPEIGPGVTAGTDDQVTYNAENLPGEMQ